MPKKVVKNAGNSFTGISATFTGIFWNAVYKSVGNEKNRR